MEKILVVKTGAIGDVLMTTPFLRELKKKHPRSHIHYLVENWSVPVLKYNPHIENLIVLKNNTFSSLKIFILISLFFRLFFLNYSKIYVLHKNRFISIYFSFLLRPIYTFFYGSFKFNPFFNFFKLLTAKSSFPKSAHHARVFARLICFSLPKTCKYDFFTPKNDLNIKTMACIDRKRPSICINPGGGDNPAEQVDVRQWGKDKYINLVDKALKNWNLNVILTGGPSDYQLCRDIEIQVGGKRIYNLSGKTNLFQLKKIIEYSDVFITGDTGGMHIAASTETPIISIFGPTDPLEKAPLNHQDSLYIKTGVSCHPCYFGKFPGCKNFICMKDIDVEKVLEALESIVKLSLSNEKPIF